LAIRVIAPTLNPVIVEDGTGMVIASTNCFGRIPTTQIDELQVGAHLTRRVTTIAACANAKLAYIVNTPAGHSAGIKEHTGCVTASDQLRNGT
jgi:hypothetical protein